MSRIATVDPIPPRRRPGEPTGRTPEELINLLKQSGDFDPAATRPEYQAQVRDWRFALDLYELEPAKLRLMVDAHGPKEPPEKLAMRRAMAVVYNLIPMVVNMASGYLFGRPPAIDTKGRQELDAFVADCDGGGTPLVDFLKQTALPMSQVYGWLDVLVDTPSVVRRQSADGTNPPAVYPISPLKRHNWGAKPNNDYFYVAFTDDSREQSNPLRRDNTVRISYVTLAEAGTMSSEGTAATNAVWFRHSQGDPIERNGDTPMDVWNFEGDFCPTARVPVATIYHQRSNDPDRKHHGISKIGMMAMLINQIIQILSWTAEDVLANLALLAVPTKNGVPPDKPMDQIGAFTMLFYDSVSASPPSVVQGEVSHIEIKLKLVESHVREILRLANLLGASAAAEKVTSGVQGVVMRNELFQEMHEKAGALDAFTMELLALVSSWATNKDVKAADLKAAGVTVSHNKGPYAMEPLDALVATAQEAVTLLQAVSPTATEAAYGMVAGQLLAQQPDKLQDALAEIEENSGNMAQLTADAQAATLGADAATAKRAAADAQAAAAGEAATGQPTDQ